MYTPFLPFVLFDIYFHISFICYRYFIYNLLLFYLFFVHFRSRQNSKKVWQNGNPLFNGVFWEKIKFLTNSHKIPLFLLDIWSEIG